MSNAARIINNNSKRHRRRRRRRLLPSVMFCWTQKSLLAVGVIVLVLVFFFMVRWRGGGSQQQENKIDSNNNRDKSGQEQGLSKKNAQKIILNKENDDVRHHYPFVDSSFHLSNKRPKTGQIQEGAARIIERSPPPPPSSSDPLSKTLQQPKKTSRKETAVETQAAAAVANLINNNDMNINNNDECLGKERLVQILIDAGMSRENVTQTYCRDLPTWNTVVDLYGSQPVVVQHQCQRRQRQSSDDSDTPPLQPRVAGLYNTGTNALVKLLPLNLPQSMWAVVPDDDDDDDDDENSHNITATTGQQEQQQDMRNTAGRTNNKKKKTTYFDWDVPWGKHNPPGTFYNQGIYMPGQANVSIHDILPIIVVKDPYWWMQSMCRNRYGVQWKNDDDVQQAPSQGEQQQQQQRCPYLMSQKKQKPVPISVHRTVRRKEYVQDYDSLLHLWTDFYSQYLLATIQDKKNVDSPSPVTLSGSPVVDFPFVMVRFEDLLFHAPAVLQAIANCANGYDTSTSTQKNIKSENDENSNKKPPRPFSYFLPKSKSHGKTSTDFVSAMIKYGSTRGRTDGMLPEDLQFAQQHLQQSLQAGQQYGQQPLTDSSSSSSLMQIFHYQTA